MVRFNSGITNAAASWYRVCPPTRADIRTNASTNFDREGIQRPGKLQSMAVQNQAAKKQLSDAVTYLEAARKHAADGVKTSGKEFQTSVRQTIADARAAVQKVSEAVAAKRTADSTQPAKK